VHLSFKKAGTVFYRMTIESFLEDAHPAYKSIAELMYEIGRAVPAEEREEYEGLMRHALTAVTQGRQDKQFLKEEDYEQMSSRLTSSPEKTKFACNIMGLYSAFCNNTLLLFATMDNPHRRLAEGLDHLLGAFYLGTGRSREWVEKHNARHSAASIPSFS
jgi:hypothetical protein